MRSDLSVAAPTPGAIFALAWPMTLRAIFLHGIVVVDGWLVSSLGEAALASMGLASALGGIVLGTIFAFSHATQIRTAQAYGTADPVLRKSVLASGLALSLLVGAVGLIVVMTAGQALLLALAPSAAIAAQAWVYLSIFLVVIAGESIGQAIASYFNGCGRTKIPLVGYLLSVPINITSSYVLIHGLWGLPAMGLAGAALGSALAVSIQTLFWVAMLWRLEGGLLTVKGWQDQRFGATAKRHAVFALPIAATFVSANFSGHVCTLIYAKMPLHAFAAMTLIAPWNMVAGQISMQWTQATGIMVAQLLGARADEPTLDRFLGGAWRGAFVAAGIVATFFLIMCLSVDLIYPDLSPQTRAILWSFLPILVLVQVPRATNAICGNTLRASGDTVYVMKLFLATQWAFRVPLTALAVLYFELSAFWVLSLILWEEFVKFFPFHRRLWRGDWKRASVMS